MNREEILKAAEATWERHENEKSLCYKNSEVDRIAIERFIAGAEAEAESKWISVNERTPIATESGHWDGLRSEFVLAVNRDRNYVIARVYEGKMDGSHFLDWVDSNDTILDGKHDEIIMWQYITP